MTTANSLPALLARWFDDRLYQAGAVRTALARLYALDVVDVDGLERLESAAARVTFLGEASTLAELAALPVAAELDDHDAAAVTCVRWTSGAAGVLRPATFAARRRAHLVQVTTDHGCATVARFGDDGEAVLVGPAA